MTLEKIIEITKWTILATNFIGLFSIFVGIASPLFSPTGRRSQDWMEIGFEILRNSIPAAILYTIIYMN